MSNLKKSVLAIIAATATLVILTGCGSNEAAQEVQPVEDVTVSEISTEFVRGENGCYEGLVPDTTIYDDSYGSTLYESFAYTSSYRPCVIPEVLEQRLEVIEAAEQEAQADATALTQSVNGNWDKLGTLINDYCSRASSHKTYVAAARELWEENWTFPNAYDLPRSFDAAMSAKCYGGTLTHGAVHGNGY